MEEAATVLSSGIYEFRALVTDVNSKGKTSGWDLARLVRERDPEFPVVYMTGMDADEWARLGVPKSILLTKPFAPAQFVTAVSQLLTRDRPLSEGAALWTSEQSNEGDQGEQTGRGHAPA